MGRDRFVGIRNPGNGDGGVAAAASSPSEDGPSRERTTPLNDLLNPRKGARSR